VSLRPYQEAAIESAREAIRGGRTRIVLVAPTGSGKTHVAAAIIGMIRGRALFMAHTEEIIGQTSAKLAAAGVHHGIIKAGFRPTPSTVQVASVQTLFRRLEQRPEAEVVILDECHHVGARTFRAVVDAYPEAIILGFTATPYRLDGQGLGDVFQELVQVAQVSELIADGHLVPTVVYGARPVNLRDVPIVGGDYARGALGAAMGAVTGDVVSHYHRFAAGRAAVCFAVTIEHSRALVERFGPIARHVDANTPNRAALLAGLGTEYQVLVNVGITTEGWDLPRIGCVIMARPTMSRGLHRQMIGRGMRPWGDKTECLVLDHAGNCQRHGFVEDPETHTLAGRERRKREDVAPVTQCAECFRVYPSTEPVCPNCGAARPYHARRVKEVSGDLVRVDRASYYRADQQAGMLRRWVQEQEEKGFKVGYPAVRFRRAFGRWPTPRELATARRTSSTQPSLLSPRFQGL
jgi:superfamily II DNA or RNA helicase